MYTGYQILPVRTRRTPKKVTPLVLREMSPGYSKHPLYLTFSEKQELAVARARDAVTLRMPSAEGLR